MPYKDPEQKKQWERLHRSERLTRRRELRRAEAARQAAQPTPRDSEAPGAAFLLPVITGGAVAAHNPVLAIGAGALTLVVAALYKKDWRWWLTGMLILAFGLFFHWNSKDEEK